MRKRKYAHGVANYYRPDSLTEHIDEFWIKQSKQRFNNVDNVDNLDNLDTSNANLVSVRFISLTSSISDNEIGEKLATICEILSTY